MTQRVAVELGGVQKTLLLPLWGRAVESLKKRPVLVDTTAVEIIRSIEFDFSTIAANMSPITQLAWIARSLHIDRTIRRFLETHAHATVVNIGCGLDTTFERVDNGSLRWLDLDLPDVIELRRRFLPDRERRRNLACSFLEEAWLGELEEADAIIFVAGGVFYYFEETQIRDFLTRLAGLVARGEIIFDVASPLGVRVSNKKVIEAGGMDEQSVLKWGIEDPRAMQQWDSRIQLTEAYPMFHGVKRRLGIRHLIGMTMSDALRIMSMVHLTFSK
jgi:O-methyltransferase involved in polyketide biosynthesis